MSALEYVLGTLSADARQAFQRQKLRDPAQRAAVVFWTEHIASLARDLPPVTPPAQVLDDVSAQLFGTPKRSEKLAQSLRLGIGLALLAYCGWVLFLSVSPAINLRTNDIVSQLQSSDGYVVIDAAFDPDTVTLHLQRVSGGPAVGRDWQLWLISGNDPPRALGIVPLTQQGHLRLSVDIGQIVAGSVLALSDEPAGGSIAPTGDYLALTQMSR